MPELEAATSPRTRLPRSRCAARASSAAAAGRGATGPTKTSRTPGTAASGSSSLGTRAVNEPSRSLAMPGEGPYYDPLLVKSALLKALS